MEAYYGKPGGLVSDRLREPGACWHPCGVSVGSWDVVSLTTILGFCYKTEGVLPVMLGVPHCLIAWDWSVLGAPTSDDPSCFWSVCGPPLDASSCM